MMTVLLITFLFQYLPKIYHFVCLLRRMQNLYAYSVVWWNIALNFIAIFVASHVTGACWYLLGIQRAAKCLKEQCSMTPGCGLRTLACEEPIYYGTGMSTDNFDYGAYEWTVQLVTIDIRLERMLLPFFWGLMNLRKTFFQVPLFQHMDELVLESVCDRLKSLIFPKGEMTTREGDLVRRMIFVVMGHLQNNQVLRDGVKSCCMLGPGNFYGDELLSWCLRRPFVECLPPSSSTFVTLETTKAFGLEAEDLKYKVGRSARYYSPGWRTWAAIAILLDFMFHCWQLD
ncbi:hypothetical protein NE237_032767 [Protea cynaroides]|uniref:Cyclic nucleotide-binding domain-containing protein n=1 Tax=Protea cynaroides TaxID=273540 RepID=A0A9Q0R3V8_9MAGN|nr:hypothetical protein NE237_032767 [Protea cynaroides]